MEKTEEDRLEPCYAMDDEIDIWELIQVIWRYKGLIATLFVLSILASLVVSKMMTPQYKISSHLMVVHPEVISPADLTAVLKTVFKKKVSNIQGYPLKSPNIKYNRRSRSRIIELSFRSTRPDKAIGVLKDQVDKVVKTEVDRLFSGKYQYELKDVEEQIKAKQAEIDYLMKELDRNSKRLKELEDRYSVLMQKSKEVDRAARQGMLPALILVQNEISSLRQQVYDQGILLNSDRQSIESLRLKKKEILNIPKGLCFWSVPPYASKRPVRPRPFLYAVLAGVLALLIGIFLAFLLNAIRESRLVTESQA